MKLVTCMLINNNVNGKTFSWRGAGWLGPRVWQNSSGKQGVGCGVSSRQARAVWTNVSGRPAGEWPCLRLGVVWTIDIRSVNSSLPVLALAIRMYRWRIFWSWQKAPGNVFIPVTPTAHHHSTSLSTHRVAYRVLWSRVTNPQLANIDP